MQRHVAFVSRETNQYKCIKKTLYINYIILIYLVWKMQWKRCGKQYRKIYIFICNFKCLKMAINQQKGIFGVCIDLHKMSILILYKH